MTKKIVYINVFHYIYNRIMYMPKTKDLYAKT